MENGNVLQHGFGRFSPEFFFFTIFSRISTAHLPPGHIAYCPFPNIVTGCFVWGVKNIRDKQREITSPSSSTIMRLKYIYNIYVCYNNLAVFILIDKI